MPSDQVVRQLGQLPAGPGVYLFRDEEGEVLYVGKAKSLRARVRQYFQAGAQAVWLIYPNLEVFHIYDSFTQIRVLTRDDILDGGDIIPGFQIPLSSLFEEEEPEEGGHRGAHHFG